MWRDRARERYTALMARAPARPGDWSAGAAAPRILLVRPDHLGDVLLTSPAISALRRALPQARLDALVGPWAADTCAHCAAVDEVRTLAFPGFERGGRRAPWGPYVLLERAARDLRSRRYDAAVLLRPDHWWGAALAARAGIPLRIGYALPPGVAALTHAIAPAPRTHAVRAAWRLARTTAALLGAGELPPEDISPTTAPLRWRVAPEERAAARRWLAARGLVGDRAYVVLHPGSGALVKQWGAASWARVLERITAERDQEIILAGAPAERCVLDDVATALADQYPSHVFISEGGIGVYAALLAGARLMLGVDSGPLHLAVALATPSAQLYGPTDRAIFGPWGPPDRHAALVSGLGCVPCGRLDYPRGALPWHPCMAVITPEAVARAALRVMAAAGHESRATDRTHATGAV